MSDAEPVVAVIEGESQEDEIVREQEEEEKEEKPAEEDKKAPEHKETETEVEVAGALIPAAVYMEGDGEQDVLHRIAARQSKIVRAALDALAAEDPDARRAAKAGADDDEIARRRVGALLSAAADFRVLSRALEDDIFGERAMRRLQIQPNGCLDHDPKLNFYPPFVLPEALATYHLFFQNQVIPLSCRANRPDADAKLVFAQGDSLPETATLQEVPRIFDGLGSEVQPLDSKSLQKAEAVDQGEESQGALIELEGDSPRLAVLKRSIRVTHAAYPALALPPKVMTALMENLIMARPEAKKDKGDDEPEPGAEPVVDDDTLARWLGLPAAKQVKTLDERERREKALVERRRLLHSVVLVSVTQACLRRFFARRDMVRRIGESIHYLFKHGYVRQACRVAEVELTHLVSYMGLMHENRVGHSVLHSTLEGEARRDYIRDTLYLLLVYTWQTAMGAWQQCLDPTNVLELAKILRRKRRDLWSGFDERTISEELSRLVFPEPLLDALAQGLPDIAHQSQLHNFRSFILERSGILPAMCNALPTDFVPLYYREAPPQLWGHVFLLRLASFLMYQNDLAELPFDGESSPLLECHCRCNLCSPHRSLIHNTALLNEVQCIGSFQLQAPPTADGEQQQQPPLTLTPAVWTNAYLKKFEDDDFYHDVIRHYELQKSPQARAPLTACVITAPAIVAQLQNIAAARREFLAKKGSGVYLDPVTGDVLGTGRSPAPVTARTAPAVTAHGGSTSILRLPPSSSSSTPQPHHNHTTTTVVATAAANAEHETTDADAEDHLLILAARRALEALGNQSDPLYSEKLVQAVEDYAQQLRRRENGPDSSLAADAWRRRVSVERELDRFLRFSQSEGRGRGAVAARRLGQLIGGGFRGGGGRGDGRGRGGGGYRRRGASFNRRRGGGGLGRNGGGGVLGGCPRAATPLHDDARLNDVPEGPTTTTAAGCAGCSCGVAASASSANVAV